MKIRYEEYKEGEDRWLYDIKEDVLYKITDNNCSVCNFDIYQLSKFCPYAKVVKTYVINPYKVKK